MLVEMRNAGKEPTKIEHSLQTTNELDEKSEVGNNQNILNVTSVIRL
jgi:hypothetical protein